MKSFFSLMLFNIIILHQKKLLQKFFLIEQFLFVAAACGNVELELFYYCPPQKYAVQVFVPSPHKTTMGRTTQYLIIYSIYRSPI